MGIKSQRANVPLTWYDAFGGREGTRPPREIAAGARYFCSPDASAAFVAGDYANRPR
jgi:hypothetical protein